ncbi:MAG TPA: serine/threonine-protein kinase [Candidatus Acidoferrales bacterium]|jgi:serine/threonine-protein kinase|nr:serine/threonine-protein kinase [Candidatus Acidoferrales bacterium]
MILFGELRVGEQLDHYEIESVVAQSGMAAIYRAKDLRTGQTVAIKVPHFEVESDPLLFDRFERERAIGKRLSHPGIMKVFDSGERSRVYMVMEWIDGKLLRHVLTEEKKLPVERATRLTIEICEALSYIHEHGVVHRDLKPENIMVDAEDHIKLIDFGIANCTGMRRLTFGKLTPTMGTADYISPEQVKSKRGDARSDIYAVGVMLYEMLTGDVPFQGPSPLAVMNGRLLNDPIPPRTMNPEISAEMQEIIYRALEREAQKRYADADQFADDLRKPESVSVAERRELVTWTKQRSAQHRRILFYAAMAMIPVVIFVLLLLTARR